MAAGARRAVYPLFQRGGPQLRIFRPNFFMLAVRPGVPQPEDTVQFRVSMECEQQEESQESEGEEARLQGCLCTAGFFLRRWHMSLNLSSLWHYVEDALSVNKPGQTHNPLWPRTNLSVSQPISRERTRRRNSLFR
ncbi:large ribosomal subunit protein uL23m isoform X2 [Poecile atricapillus]|uniref:large ribosomal subunit protein uL23m isoform X2 n=1 Tax=Poecile atricapillus TaxID=48891 RepID=UPI00273848FD|nr:large ribosomal subunit protein uL23m isoform X2 [Poecile atricapillus]